MYDSRLANIVGQIYEAALDEMPWSGVLCEIADFCGGENVALVVVDSRLDYSCVTTPRADPEVISAYTQHWWQHDPTSNATASSPVGQLTTLKDTGRERFLQSRFHNEFWRRSGLGTERVAANLVVGDGMFSSVVLQASIRRDEIGDTMFPRFSPLVPHLIRAVNISRKLYRMEMQAAVADGGADRAGTMVVDAEARVIFADARAEALLVAGNELRLAQGVLHLAQPCANARLRMAIAACATTDPQLPAEQRIPVARKTGGSPLAMEVFPYCAGIARMVAVAAGCPAPAAMLVVRDPDMARLARIAALRERYDLTQAEAALAVEMLRGDGRLAAAARCGISINTARTHLMRVFEKTGVTRQAELVRLLLD